MAPAVRKIIPPPPNANPENQSHEVAHEQGAFKTIGGKDHQAIDAPRRMELVGTQWLSGGLAAGARGTVRPSCPRSAPPWRCGSSRRRPEYRNRPRSGSAPPGSRWG